MSIKCSGSVWALCLSMYEHFVHSMYENFFHSVYEHCAQAVYEQIAYKAFTNVYSNERKIRRIFHEHWAVFVLQLPMFLAHKVPKKCLVFIMSSAWAVIIQSAQNALLGNRPPAETKSRFRNVKRNSVSRSSWRNIPEWLTIPPKQSASGSPNVWILRNRDELDGVADQSSRGIQVGAFPAKWN